MINNKQIVPITVTDLLTLYGNVLKIANVNVTALSGNVTANGTYIADAPVESIDFASGVSSATVYFVAAYDYKGFSINGTAVETDAVENDASTLYVATLSGGSVTVAKVGF